MKNNSYAALAVTAVTLAIVLGGCGGGGVGGVVPPAPRGTARIEGEVRAADNLDLRIGYAEVAAQPARVTTTATATGAFALSDLPAGDITLQVNPLHHPGYQAATVIVPVESDKTTHVTIALLPAAAEAPTQIAIGPTNPSVEAGGVINFGSTVRTASGVIAVSPTWLATEGIGTISALGQFQAQQVGTGTVVAASGGISSSTTVTVTTPQPPDISTVVISPIVLPASGGPLSIVAAVSDGQSIGVVNNNPRVQADVTLPTGLPLPPLPMNLDAGSLQDGTFRTTYDVPSNGNVPDMWGVQAPQTYTVQIAAWDSAGHKATSSDYTFTVRGVQPPPLPPDALISRPWRLVSPNGARGW